MAAVANGAASTDAAAAAAVPAEAQDPGSYPLAAQIPLKSFQLPAFPPQASRLRELTLTADIKLDEYQSMVQTPPDAIITQPPLDELPQSITHLTFELFGLGFPGTPPFLTRLARSLPNIRSVTFFSCLIDGLDEHSRRDAEKFFSLVAPNLKELHVIDSFARPGFFTAVGAELEKHASLEPTQGFKLVDVSYTFRGHEDSDFLARVQGEDLSSLVVKGMVGASFDFVPQRRDELQEAEADEEGKDKPLGKLNEGVLPFACDGRAPSAARKRFETLSHGGELKDLKILNLAMWSLRPAEVGHVVYACAGGARPGLADLTVSVLLEDGWVEKLASGLDQGGVAAELESLELVGVPDRAEEEGDDWKAGLKVVTKEDVEKIARGAPKLAKAGMSILKVKTAPNVLFYKTEGEGWKER
ncbi:hypothetical protein A1O7_00664 [Cladophialophora yegresii CBS 114405]|uniref:Uncharacterized protein n=1 Tax=Cladophialophora yegresii CBS 114405 TaxID=1182544 RepID=W9W8P9_9EURO|nr:uncharacterized protein A1O7_00664 [Cladophialophora yegresii CBS 114405]EXJ64328.1 hypothetical protein A1O7_00664 [Cladophialophora yegresii CBS 114405]